MTATTLFIVAPQRDISRPVAGLAGRVEREVGGVQVHIENARRAATAAGLDVTVVTAFDGWWGLPLIAATVTKVLDRVDPVRAARWHRWWHRTLVASSLRRRLRSAREGGRRVVCYAQDPASAAAVRRLAPTARLVAACHFSGGSEGMEMVLRGVCGADHPIVAEVIAAESAALARCDGLVVVSADAGRVLLDRHPELTTVPLTVVPNFIPDDWAAAVERPAAPSRDLVTIGAVNPIKNHRYLVDVVEVLRDGGRPTTLTIVGDGVGRADLEADVARRGLGDLVRVTGHRADVRPELVDHRLYVHASTAETFGIALVEAMAVGLGVAAVPVGGISEVFDPGVEGVHLPSGDAAAAAAVVGGLLDDPERLAAMGRAGVARVAERFSAGGAGAALVDLLVGAGVRS